MPERLTQTHNTDFFHQYQKGQDLIVEALQFTLSNATLPGNLGLLVYADSVTVADILMHSGKNIVIHAREIIFAPGARVDVSGESRNILPPGRGSDGQNFSEEGKKGDDGAPGGNGGSVALMADTITGEVSVLANGGAGGAGARGGDGHDGRNGSDGADGNATPGVDNTDSGQPGEDGGLGGAGGPGSTGGSGGDAGIIIIKTLKSLPPAQLKLQSEGGKGGGAGDHGTPGKGGRGGVGGREETCTEGPGCLRCDLSTPQDVTFLIENVADKANNLPLVTLPLVNRQIPVNLRPGNSEEELLYFVRKDFVRQVEGTSRAFLRGHCEFGGRAQTGRNGQDGSLSAIPAILGLDGATKSPIVEQINHSEMGLAASKYQLRMLLHRAELDYLNSKFEPSALSLSWLADLTEGLPDVPVLPQDVPLQLLHIPGTARADLSEWQSLHQRAITLISQMQSGFDYYGNAQDYVTLVNLKTYQAAIEGMISIGAAIEEDHDSFFAKQAEPEQRLQALDATIANSGQVLRDMEGELQRVGAAKDPTQDAIKVLDKNINKEEELLENAADEFLAAVDRLTNQCSLKDIFEAVRTIVTVAKAISGDVSDIVNAGKAYGKGAHQFDDVVKVVKAVGSEINEIREEVNKLKAAFPAHPDAGKLLANREEFERTLNQFKALTESQAYRKQLDNYLGAVQAKNLKLLDYTALRLQEERLRAEISQRRAEINQVRDLRALTSDPGLVEYVSFMSRLSAEAKSILLRSLYQENKAFEYWALVPSKLDINDSTIAALSTTHNRLSRRLLDKLAERNRAPQRFDKAEILISKSTLSPEAFEEFKKTGTLTFTIPIDEPQLTGRGLSEILVSHVELVINDVRTASGEVIAYINHSGRALFVDRNGGRHQYSHAYRWTRYAYLIQTGVSLDPSDVQNLVGSDDNFAYLSPFTSWMLMLDKRFNRGLDLNNFTDLRLRFSGFFMPFNLMP